MSRILRLWDTLIGEVPATLGGPTPAKSPLVIPSGNLGGALGASLNSSGNANLQVASAGVQPGATGVDSVLAVYALPAGFFDAAGRGINVLTQGSALNATSKVIKVIFGATTAVVGQTVTGGATVASFTTTAAGGWQLEVNVFKYGAAGSNTQIAAHVSGQAGATVGALVAPSLLTAVESAAILIAVTGNANPTTDLTFNFLEVFAMN